MIPVMADSFDETPVPKAWTELIHALTLMARHASNDISPFDCNDGELTVMSSPSKFTDQELAYLDQLGFGVNLDDDTFYSFRYGSA
jgi:hypothetical protein